MSEYEDVMESLGGLSYLQSAEPDYWDWVLEQQPPHVAIHTAINRMRRDVGRIAKLGVNQSGSRAYSFKRVEDVYAAVQDSGVRHGVLVMPVGVKVLEQMSIPITYQDSGRTITGSSVRVEVRYEWTGPMGDKMFSVGLGEGFDTSDKASSKATQAAMKYALIQALQIADDSIEDADKVTIEKSYVQPKNPGAAFESSLSPTQANYAKKGWPGDASELDQAIEMVEAQRDLVKKVLHKDSGAVDAEKVAIRTTTMGSYPPDPAKYEAIAAVLDPVVKRLSEDQPDPAPAIVPDPPEAPANDVGHVVGVDPDSIQVAGDAEIVILATIDALKALVDLLPPMQHTMFVRWQTKYGVEIGPRMSPKHAEAAIQTIQMLRSE